MKFCTPLQEAEIYPPNDKNTGGYKWSHVQGQSTKEIEVIKVENKIAE
jgi:hypothetical protein